MSAVSMVDAISVLFINIFAALGTGGAAICGQYLGRGNEDRARRASEHLTIILFASSFVIASILLIMQSQILEFLYGSAEKAVRDNCYTYYHIVMFSIPCIAIYNGLAAVFRTTGDSKTPLIISAAMNIINIVGNATLIFVFHLGVAGVAIPTLLSRAIAMIAIIACALKKDFMLNIRKIAVHKPESKLLKDIFGIGVPNGIEGGMFQFGKLILMSLVSTLSTASITANAVGNAVGPVHLVIGISVNNVLIAVVSRCAGAGDYRQARWYVRYFMKFTVIYQTLVNIGLILLIPFIARIYSLSEETTVIASEIMFIHSAGTIFLWPCAFMYNTAMRAAGDSQYAMWISTISMWLCRVGGAYLLIKVFNVGVLGVWIAWNVDWVFRMCFFIPRYLGHKWEEKAVKD